jgi:hypothetical protein
MTPEYYWLCPACSAAMRLHIGQEGKVVPLAVPTTAHGTGLDKKLVPTERREGLLLSNLSFSTERPRRRPRFAD